MKLKHITTEHLLYGLAIFLALGIRFLRLGATPLSDYEAGWALQALGVAHGASTGQLAIGSQPGYVVITGLLFFIFGDRNALARLIPALAGAALVSLPLLFHRMRGFNKTAGLILAFGLALDPGLVALSREAGSPIPALSFSLLALGLAYNRKLILAGILAGLALLSGSAILAGILGLALTWIVVKLLHNETVIGPLSETESNEVPTGFNRDNIRQGIFFGVGTLVVAGTLFLIIPQGLGGLANMLPDYLAGWVSSSGIPALRLPVALLVYQPLVVIFAIISIVRGWLYSNRLAQSLSLWAVIALVLAILYPARQTGDLAWALVPLWVLAALELAWHLPDEIGATTRLVSVLHSLMVFVLLVLIWFNLLRMGMLLEGQFWYWVVIGVVVFMGIIVTLLISAGWSPAAARYGLVWGLSAALGLYMISGTWGASQLRANNPRELWNVNPGIGEADLLSNTLGDLSEWHTSLRQFLDIVVITDNPSMRWALRDLSNVRYNPELAAGNLPGSIISQQDQKTPSLAASYRGQDFAWLIYPDWSTILPANWLRWVIYRDAPVRNEQVILWARSDLFPGGVISQNEAVPPQNEPLK